jgi:imidazolonepropionase-like amidohydrolase
MREAFVALIACTLLSVAGAEENANALVNANLFNGIENRIQAGVTVLVADGKIEAIVDGENDVDAAYNVVDMQGNFLLPGLFDVHTHVSNLQQAERALLSGTTTVRSASVTAFQDVALRELVRAGRIAGPDVVAAGVYVTPDLGDTVLADPRFGEIDGRVDSDDELRLLVQINADRGVDVIKTRGTERAGLPGTDPRQQVYSERQLRVIVDAAASHGLPVMVHAHGD